MCTKQKTEEIYKNTLHAFRSGKPSTLHFDSDREHQKKRRDAAMLGHPKKGDGTERDDYPYASTFEGGEGAVVADIPAREQRVQGGQLRALYKTMNQGEAFLVMPVPRDKEPDEVPPPAIMIMADNRNRGNNSGKVISLHPIIETGARWQVLLSLDTDFGKRLNF